MRKFGEMRDVGAGVLPPSAISGTKKQSSMSRANSSMPGNASEGSTRPMRARGRMSESDGTGSADEVVADGKR